MTNAGIDYGMGRSNVDQANGIRYGVISQNSVLQAWADSSEPDYGDETCPKCGNEVCEYDGEKHNAFSAPANRWQSCCADYACESCEILIDSQDAFGEEPQSWNVSDGEYEAHSAFDNTEIFITKSPFYTLAAFCSPCAPGAGNLDSPIKEGIKTYCFGHDWFEEGKAPYRVFRVSDDSEVLS